LLAFIGYQEVDKLIGQLAVHAGTLLRVHGHDHINVQEIVSGLDERHKGQFALVGQEGGRVGQGVGLQFIGHVKGGSHALPSLDVPLAGGVYLSVIVARLLPEKLLAGVGAGVVASGYKLYLARIGLALLHDGDKGRGGVHAADACRIVLWAYHVEVVVGYASSLQAVPVLDELQLSLLIVDHEHVHVAALSVLDGYSCSPGDHIQRYVILCIELLLDRIKKP